MHIEKWDGSQLNDLNIFCKKAADSNIPNNSSIDAMAIEKRSDVGLFLLYLENEIAGVSYTHRLDSYTDTFRVGTRTCVLPKYRKFKLYFPKASLAQAIGLTAYTIKFQWDHAINFGAKTIVWTTNNYGDKHSMKMTKYLRKFADRNIEYYKFLENKYIYNTDQSVWQLLKRDITC
tara:strand:- start:8532 stop:9059 length:528 start_codon:yes stop_codon:yes gene_type:complete